MNTIEARYVPVAQIRPNPNQPRKRFSKESLAELADSIRAHGVIQPVEVEALPDGGYMLHHGERRWRAAKLAGLETIPAVIAAAQDDDTLLVRGLLENLYREDLNPIEEAQVFRGLLDAGWTRIRISRETGINLNRIAGRLDWLALEPEIQALVAAGTLPRNEQLARELRRLSPEVRVPLARKLAAHGVGLKGSLNAVTRAREKLERAAPANDAPPHPTPMIRHGVNGNGNGTPLLTVYEAAAQMCRSCYLKPRGEVVPAWELVQAAASAVCEACQKKDGPALPDICRNCPGVAMVKAMMGGLAEQGDGSHD